MSLNSTDLHVLNYLFEQGLCQQDEFQKELSLDSYSIVLLIYELENKYKLDFYPDDLIPQNFGSPIAISGMVQAKLAKLAV